MKYVHTCYRVFDLDRSLDFFTNKLGLELTHKSPARDEATNAFLTVPSSAGSLLPADNIPAI